MEGVLATETAILVGLDTVGSISLVLCSVVVSLLAFAANESNFYSFLFFHPFSAPPYKMLPPSELSDSLVTYRRKSKPEHNKKDPTHRGRAIIALRRLLVKSFFVLNCTKSKCFCALR